MLAIRNFGHFWSRDLVDWGRPNSSGDLMGYQMRERQPSKVNFRKQIGIYVLFTADREAVYIGQTGAGDQRLFGRLKQHRRSEFRDRWTNFSWFGFRGVNQTGDLSEHHQPSSRCLGTNVEALDETESVLLQLFEPRLNKQGPRWGEDTHQYLQYVPWEWDPSIEEPMSSENQKIKESIMAMEKKLDLSLKGTK